MKDLMLVLRSTAPFSQEDLSRKVIDLCERKGVNVGERIRRSSAFYNIMKYAGRIHLVACGSEEDCFDDSITLYLPDEWASLEQQVDLLLKKQELFIGELWLAKIFGRDEVVKIAEIEKEFFGYTLPNGTGRANRANLVRRASQQEIIQFNAESANHNTNFTIPRSMGEVKVTYQERQN